jgi:hypothetical protein
MNIKINAIVKDGFEKTAGGSKYRTEVLAEEIYKIISASGLEVCLPEVARTYSCYLAVDFYEQDYEHEFEVRISDHTKPFFGNVQKYAGEIYQHEIDGDNHVFNVSGKKSAKKAVVEAITILKKKL